MYSSQPVPLIYSVVHETKNPAALSFLQERDHHTLEVESPEEVADLTRLALKYVPADRLILSSDCGMGREGMS